MAGYLFAFSDRESLLETINRGTYSTLVKPTWRAETTATFADFATMKPGDNVYFFSKREVFGIGEITEITDGEAFLDIFPGASAGSPKKVPDLLERCLPSAEIAPSSERIRRWIIAFKPAPHFFSNGIDMDDLLASNPSDFRSLRVFWKRSFIKFDDDENRAFMTALMRANIEALQYPLPSQIIESSNEALLSELRKQDLSQLKPNFSQYLAKKRTASGALTAEMDLEAGILFQLSNYEVGSIETFGTWNYLSHQVHASPMKAVDYMDKMDIFGYSLIPGYPIVKSYLVAELKKDKATSDDLPQLMKYVDWIRQEYANGNYGIIRAFLVAHEFDMDDILAHIEEIERTYLSNRRPPITQKWGDVTLVKYHVEETGIIRFSASSLVPFLPK